MKEGVKKHVQMGHSCAWDVPVMKAKGAREYCAHDGQEG